MLLIISGRGRRRRVCLFGSIETKKAIIINARARLRKQHCASGPAPTFWSQACNT